eukprot:scaffold8015_cov165-Ochromonas_danica.AAC.36
MEEVFLPYQTQDDAGLLFASHKALVYFAYAVQGKHLFPRQGEKLPAETAFAISLHHLLIRHPSPRHQVSYQNIHQTASQTGGYRYILREKFQPKSSGFAFLADRFGLVFSEVDQFFRLIANSPFYHSLPVS